MKRPLAELINEDEHAWTQVQEWLRAAPHPIEVLPTTRAHGEATLLALQVTTRSPMGAVALECGGILVHDGLVRVLGAGGKKMKGSLASWNALDGDPPPFLVVATDALGGFYVVNGGGLDGKPGHVQYAQPDNLEWLDLERGYSAFLEWLASDALPGFYKDIDWNGRAREVAAVAPDEGISFFPFLCTKEGQAGLKSGEISRTAVPMTELYGMWFDIR